MATTLPPELSDESLAWSSQMVVYHVTNTATKQYQGPSSTFLSKSFQKNCMRLVIRFFNVIISSAFWEFHMIHLDYIHPPQPQSFMSLIPHFRATPTNPSPNFRSFSFLHNPLSLMCAAHKRMSVGSLFGVVWIIFLIQCILIMVSSPSTLPRSPPPSDPSKSTSLLALRNWLIISQKPSPVNSSSLKDGIMNLSSLSQC